MEHPSDDPVPMEWRPQAEAGEIEVTSQPLRIISWNVYRNARPRLISRALDRFNELGPDLLLIQEAPFSTAAAFALAEAFQDYHRAYQPMHLLGVEEAGGGTRSAGQLTASARPFAHVAAYALPSARLNFGRSGGASDSVRRVALYTQLALPGGRRLGVYNVHLENRSWPEGRGRQVTYLLDRIESRGDEVVIVGGDLNTFFPRAFEASLHRFEAAGFVNLFSDERLRLLPRLDYFMVRGAVSARTLVLRGRGSDHRPIMAEITV